MTIILVSKTPLCLDAKNIFTTYCKHETKADERNKVVGSDGKYYFTTTATNTFYLILADANYPQRSAFKLLEEMGKENLHLLVDEKGEMNKLGKQSLKNLLDNYQKSDRISGVQKDIDEIKIEMNANVKKLVSNLEDAESLKIKSDKIKDSAKDFSKGARDLKRLTCWQNFKWTIILVTLIVGILLIIILPIALSGKGSDDPNGNDPSSTNSTNTANNTMI